MADISLVLFLTACGVDASKSLGDGYLHAETDSYNTYVVHEHELIVDTNVTHALAVGDFIVGLRVRPEKFVDSSESDVSSKYGYFVYDKSTGALIEGLVDAEIKRIFSDNGWDYSDLLEATL